jgi:hypothetical protein
MWQSEPALLTLGVMNVFKNNAFVSSVPPCHSRCLHCKKNSLNCCQLMCGTLNFYSSFKLDEQWLCIMHSHCASKLSLSATQLILVNWQQLRKFSLQCLLGFGWSQQKDQTRSKADDAQWYVICVNQEQKDQKLTIMIWCTDRANWSTGSAEMSKASASSSRSEDHW